MGLDPDLGAVLLAVATGFAITVIGRNRKVCESCGRRVKSVLCTCEREIAEAIDTVQRAAEPRK